MLKPPKSFRYIFGPRKICCLKTVKTYEEVRGHIGKASFVLAMTEYDEGM